MVMVCGLGVFGLWTGILATGFAAEHRRRDFIRNWDLVTRVPFLKNLDPPALIELTRLSAAARSRRAKTIVVRRGRPGDCMYFIAAGEVEVKVEPHPVRLGAGAFFGEMALLTGAARTANVLTTQPTTLLVLEVGRLPCLTAHHPELARAVAAEAARRNKPAPPNAPAQIAQAGTRKKRSCVALTRQEKPWTRRPFSSTSAPVTASSRSIGRSGSTLSTKRCTTRSAARSTRRKRTARAAHCC